MVKQFASYTKYYGEVESTDPKNVAIKKDNDIRMRSSVRRKIKHNGGKPDDYDIDVVYYQSYEDGDIAEGTPQSTHGAVYFPEPIFANSLPVVLAAVIATEKVTVNAG